MQARIAGLLHFDLGMSVEFSEWGKGMVSVLLPDVIRDWRAC